ncbi:Enamine deaminase RidA, house cleaning of reactive enamine intermediates, YjgF/YER057c/UK114 family [Agreia bicolorata]|uniref:Enamine deaminase RidA, house cleaning of reactive enamine intermediates, YjgF/YER057c/UK114 family n=1 Tax=Agreia bicolorata TaxID=110935 RepID=A0A1T4XJJ6_9MICO|nr:RidA family protein [Agreia bicolorata]SKA89583.1 Enamine deaminase RidA, house cleaning of reactive enamine intermediates, YjgF/YER057c/UK114 family [Agreia bicolorata]
MTAVTLVRSDSLAQSAPYAYASTAPADARLVFLAGACPLDPDGEVAGRGDIAAQARLCMQNLETALEAAGATLHDVLSTRVLVATTQQPDLVTAWNVVRDTFGDHDAPSTLLGVTVLGYPNQLVEVEAVAAVRD